MSAVSHEEHNLRQQRYYAGPAKATMMPTGSPYLRRHVRELLAAADARPGQRVLEIGCGMGRYTMLLAEAGIRVEGMDLSPVLLDRLREYNGGRYEIPLHVGDIVDAPAGWAGSFDRVVGLFMLHHVDDLPGCFASVHRILRGGGRAVFVEPNPYNPLYYLQMMVKPDMTWAGDKGILQMRRRVLFEAMEGAGFQKLQMRRFGFFPPFLANRPWGARLEALLERVPLWRMCLPFQIISGERR